MNVTVSWRCGSSHAVCFCLFDWPPRRGLRTASYRGTGRRWVGAPSDLRPSIDGCAEEWLNLGAGGSHHRSKQADLRVISSICRIGVQAARLEEI
jgi:hypothetical protein